MNISISRGLTLLETGMCATMSTQPIIFPDYHRGHTFLNGLKLLENHYLMINDSKKEKKKKKSQGLKTTYFQRMNPRVTKTRCDTQNKPVQGGSGPGTHLLLVIVEAGATSLESRLVLFIKRPKYALSHCFSDATP